MYWIILSLVIMIMGLISVYSILTTRRAHYKLAQAKADLQHFRQMQALVNTLQGCNSRAEDLMDSFRGERHENIADHSPGDSGTEGSRNSDC